MKGWKNWLSFTILAIIFGFIAYTTLSLFSNFLHRSDYLITGVDAFFGAFLSFLFVRLAEFLSKYYKRQVINYNSLVILGTQLNDLLGVIHDDIFVMKDFIKELRAGNVYFNKIHPLPVDKSHFETLNDMNLINEYSAFCYEVRQTNSDIDTINEGYFALRSALISNNMSHNDYKANVNLLANKIGTHIKFITALDNKLLNLLSHVRIRMNKDKPLGTRIMEFINKITHLSVSKEEIQSERKRLEKEISEVSTESKQEKADILKGK